VVWFSWPCRQLANVFQFRKAKAAEEKKADWQQEEAAKNVSGSSSRHGDSSSDGCRHCLFFCLLHSERVRLKYSGIRNAVLNTWFDALQ
jgi:hypothetical protein